MPTETKRIPGELHYKAGHNNGQVYRLDNGQTVAVLHSENQDEIGNVFAAALELLEALEVAPVRRLDETPEQFLERYKEWYRTHRYNSVAKAKGEA